MNSDCCCGSCHNNRGSISSISCENKVSMESNTYIDITQYPPVNPHPSLSPTELNCSRRESKTLTGMLFIYGNLITGIKLVHRIHESGYYSFKNLNVLLICSFPQQ